ncbi:fetuin-B-like [Myotis myotis]|uniref:fetuin-B-like n=1 Tax=Myotis myotis TaxID=51298 RepID=UPI00174E1CA9|nr:fetuin-B-like [Myotis myotis]
MGLLLLLVLCTLAMSCTTTSVPLKVPSHLPFLLRGCNDADMLAMAASVLQDINNYLKEGYVLSLNRVSAVQEHRQDGLGSLFYFTLDVLHTTCHVLSKKLWRDCEERHLHEQVYGKCKALYYVNMPLRILYLPAYNCTLRPVSRGKIQNMCPDCPIPANLSDPKVLETATETLASFNKDSESGQYSLVKVTRASSQWVFGPFYFVEYLIKESPCIKTEASSCGYQPTHYGPVGICRGTLHRRFEVKLVNINCDFFQSQLAPLETFHQKGIEQLSLVPATEEISLENIPLLKAFLFQALTPRRRKFSVYQRNKKPTHSTSKDVLSGSVQYLPELDDEESQETDPAEAFPVHLDLTTNPQGEPLNVSFLFHGPMIKKLFVLPFPKEEQRSAECPGKASMSNPILLPP